MWPVGAANNGVVWIPQPLIWPIGEEHGLDRALACALGCALGVAHGRVALDGIEVEQGPSPELLPPLEQ